jgi:hypothetical protein
VPTVTERTALWLKRIAIVLLIGSTGLGYIAVFVLSDYEKYLWKEQEATITLLRELRPTGWIPHADGTREILSVAFEARFPDSTVHEVDLAADRGYKPGQSLRVRYAKRLVSDELVVWEPK